MKLLRYYLQVFLPLVFAFAAYQTWAVPFLEPRPREQPARWLPSEEPIQFGAKWWEPYFLEGAWQRNNPLVIERDECILLYQQREQISDTRWRFKPLTIVIPQKSTEGGQRAIFIENPKGAEIQFKKPFDWASGNPPPIVNGQLLGEIKIYAPADASSAQGELLIETKDMRIDRRQVWTTEPIHMQIGNSTIEGRYLSITMDRDLLSEQAAVATADPSPFPGLDYLELFYVDRVEMGLRPGGLWPSDQIENSRQRAASASLRCGGTFVFQFHQSLATLKNGVHMEHRVEGLPVDTFDCNELKLTLGMASPEEMAAQGAGDATNRWRIDRLEAVGAPGRDYTDQTHWVRMQAPGMQAEAQAQHLMMDFVHGMVTLSNALPGTAPRNSSRVYLRRESLQVSSPQLQVQNPDLIRTTGPTGIKRLGWMIAEGIGIAQMETPDDSWALRWSKRLIIRPHEARDLIQIEGGANISSTQRGRFIAENLNMWVLPVEGDLAQRLAPHYAEGKLPQFVPDIIQANGDVMVNSLELNAQVDVMSVRFRYPSQSTELQFPQPTHAAPTPVAANNSGMVLADEAASPPARPATQPLLVQPSWPASGSNLSALPGDAAKVNGRSTPKRQAKSLPLQVQGKSLDAEIVRQGQESNVESMVLEGEFTLTREALTEEMAMPLRMTGTRLLFQTQSDSWTNVHMVGQPAKVAVGSGWIMSDELQLSQSDQLFWIDHPGELVVPVEALASVPSASAPATNGGGPGLLRADPRSGSIGNGLASIEWQSAPRLQWGEYMTFDGKSARFGGGVTLDCRMQTGVDTLWHVMASASTMTLEMASQVPLRYRTDRPDLRNRADNTKPEMRIVRLDGDVDIKAVQTDMKGVRQSTENLLLPRLELNVPTQNWAGLGPGQLLSRRIGQANPLASGASPLSVPRVPGPVSTGASTLQCLHLTFLGRVEGSMQQKMVSFYEKIDSLLGPIRDWNGAVDVRQAETLGPNQSRLLCDQLNLFDSSELSYNQTRLGSKEASWEIDALGNAQLASRTDSGDVVIDANRIGYAAMEDAVRIEGTSRRGATIRRIPYGDQRKEADEFQVSSATMRLKTGQLDAQIRRFEGSIPPQYQRPVDAQNPGPSAPPARPGAQNSPGSALPSPRDYNPLQPRGSGR
ncbi:MAG: hypothetical protein ACK553_15685 [Planctomycetota bacterium]